MKTHVIRLKRHLANQDAQSANEIKVAKNQHHRTHRTIGHAPLIKKRNEAETPVFLVRYE